MRGVRSRLSQAVTAPLLNWQSHVSADMALPSFDIFICPVQGQGGLLWSFSVPLATLLAVIRR